MIIALIDEEKIIRYRIESPIMLTDKVEGLAPVECPDWCYVGDSIEKEEPLDLIKSRNIISLKSVRDAEEIEVINCDGNLYDFDDKSRMRLEVALKALQLQGASATVDWTMADNSTTTITANDILQVFAAAAVRSNELHVKYRTLKEQVSVAEDKAAVEAINF